METMTEAEYARHRGVSRQAVNKLVLAGKLLASMPGVRVIEGLAR